jgi:hypothetical protein
VAAGFIGTVATQPWTGSNPFPATFSRAKDAGTNRRCLITVVGYISATTVDGLTATLGGVAATERGTPIIHAFGGGEFFVIVNWDVAEADLPAGDGPHTISVAFVGTGLAATDLIGWSRYAEGLDQTTAIRSSDEATETTDTPIGVTLDPTVVGDLCVVTVCNGPSHTATPDTGQTALVTELAGDSSIAELSASYRLAAGITQAVGYSDVSGGGDTAILTALAYVAAASGEDVALAGTGRVGSLRGSGQITADPALVSTGRLGAVRGLGQLASEIPLAGVARVGSLLGTAAELLITTDVVLVGTGRVGSVRLAGRLFTELPVASVGRIGGLRGVGRLTTDQALRGTARIGSVRAPSSIITLLFVLAPARLSGFRGTGLLTTDLDLVGTGRLGSVRGTAPIIVIEVGDAVLRGTGRVASLRGSGQLVTDVALTSTGRLNGGRSLGMLVTDQALAGIGRLVGGRGHGQLVTDLALTGTGRLAMGRGLASLIVLGELEVLLIGTGRLGSVRARAQLFAIDADATLDPVQAVTIVVPAFRAVIRV